ncbi:TlpA disulfide reductase family protein [Hyalangium sp. s54d21]|uniref:TlpA disulfide reductase family protein n=1 Tax=Hyalangium rubrum TaxID=3103134 RepID=A0ABU5H5L9_9BACT|nr:TlpA disulfide reductase family protein [Hyalangium sp. s54d21]MDY7228786.1 TlpA disulfide reductase family protein [Hyalangium sp. s54d21]
MLVLTALFGLGGLVYLGVTEAQRSKMVPEGARPMSFQLGRYGGGTLALEDLRGKVVMLDFWATWCPPCQEEMPALVKLAKEYESQGLVFVAASRDDDDVKEEVVDQFVKRFLPELGPYVVYANDDVARAFKVEALPTLYFLDREGKVTDAVRGMMSEAALRKRIERALKP